MRNTYEDIKCDPREYGGTPFNMYSIIITIKSRLFDLRTHVGYIHYTIVNMSSGSFDIPHEQDYYGIFSVGTITQVSCANVIMRTH